MLLRLIGSSEISLISLEAKQSMNASSNSIATIVLGAAILMSGCQKSSSSEAKSSPSPDSKSGNEVNGSSSKEGPGKDNVTGSNHQQGRKPIPAPEIIKQLPPDGGPEYNRLVFESSPYLLQHAGNPVDWYPWGQEAFDKARKENKPIFLSVGYSTCHWCHVMEKESFEKNEIGELLNKHFVSIKLDREERPDLDKVYMMFIQALPGIGGGWPMSVWMTADRKPFYGGTYFPPKDQYGRPGFPKILNRIAEAWETDKEELLTVGSNFEKQMRIMASQSTQAAVEIDKSQLDAAYDAIKASYEPVYGGFAQGPKFPRPVAPNFLLRYYHRTGKQEALDMTLFTLNKMADGGMYDHIGGGFHRYSVDTRWHVPHFEKMLYDQGQLVGTYLDAYQVTGESRYADVARDILKYVKRDMTGEHGQFFSAEDADSPIPGNPEEQEEGAFYVWTHEQIVEILGEDVAAVFNHYYDVKQGGNVASDPHGEFRNKNVLIIADTLENTASKFERTPEQVKTLLADARAKLFPIREKRPRPHLDDKTLTAWNGLMISAFARAGQILGDSVYVDDAKRTADFVRKHLFDTKKGTLLRRYRKGDSDIDGYVDDYAYFIQSLLDLYEASFDIEYLTWAITLQEKQNELFWDQSAGGYYNTSGTDNSVLVRLKESYDGAEPSPNSISFMNLLRLAQMTGKDTFKQYADKTLAAFSSRIKEAPYALPQMMAAFDFYLDKPMQIIIAGKPKAKDTRALLSAVHDRFIPNKVLLLADGAKGQETLAGYVPFFSDLSMIDDKATAYICEDYACKLPTHDVDTVVKMLSGKTTVAPGGADVKGE